MSELHTERVLNSIQARAFLERPKTSYNSEWGGVYNIMIVHSLGYSTLEKNCKRCFTQGDVLSYTVGRCVHLDVTCMHVE
jgi:hypothetical protein